MPAAITVQGTLVFENGTIHFVLGDKSFSLTEGDLHETLKQIAKQAVDGIVSASNGAPSAPTASAMEALMKDSEAAFRKAKEETAAALKKAEKDYANATANLVRASGLESGGS